MGMGFDIVSGSPKPQKKAKKRSNHRDKKSGSIFSWLFLIAAIFIVGSFLASNKSLNEKLPETSINNEVLADKLDEEKQEVIPQVSKDDQSPKNPTDDLGNAVSESSEKDGTQTSEDIKDTKNSSFASLNKLELKIKILNGSGETKQAANAKERLEQAGYIIAKIDTANNIYATTVIYCNKDNEEHAGQISQDLDVNAKTDTNSKITGKYDYVIVVGKDYIAKTQN